MIVSQVWLEAPLGAALLGWRLFRCASSACSINRPPEQHFYDQHIQPILNNFCVGNTSPCHRIDPASGIALGNLDLSSFESVQKRRDVLRTYGSYPQPLLLLKSLTLGSGADPLSTESSTTARSNTPAAIRSRRPPTPTTSSSAGWTTAPTATGWRRRSAGNMGKGAVQHRRSAQSTADRSDTTRRIKPSSSRAACRTRSCASCAFATCHSSPQSDFYMTCGDDDTQKQYNFSRAASFVAAMGIAVEQSEILLRPLAPAAGGVSHTGGVFFSSRDDDGWKSWKDWAEQVQANPPYTLTRSAGPAVLRGQRDAQAPAARVRARGLPQPRRLQRLPPALGRAGLLLAVRARAQLRDGAEGVHRARHRRRASSRARSRRPSSRARAA